MIVSVVIPNFNGRIILEKNLPKILETANNPKNHIIEIIVVDDGSSDDSVSFLTKSYKNKIKLIKHTKNRGFFAAINTGVRATKGNLVLLMNTDIIPTKNFLEPVFPLFENPKVFSVSMHQTGHGSVKGYFAEGYIQLGMTKETKVNHPSFYTSWECGIFRKSIWQELAGIDERLFSPLYWGDIDLSFRAAKRGYLNLWEPEAKVAHKHESATSQFTNLYLSQLKDRNQLLMLWKNIHSKNLIRKHILSLITGIIKHPGYLKIIIMALSKFGLVLRARNKEIKESVASDEIVFAQFNKYS